MPLAVGDMWAVSADTELPDLASYILTSLLDKDIQVDFLQKGMSVAPIVLDKKYFQGLSPIVETMWGIVNDSLAAGEFGYTTWAFYPPETRLYLYEGIVNVLEDNISVEEYLAEMDRLNKKELAGGFTPVVPGI